MSVNMWRDVIGWEGYYQVSSQGEVRSVTRTVKYRTGNRCHKLQGKNLSIFKDKDGYLKVWLGRNGKGSTKYVHILVLNAFVGPCPPGLVCRHLDGNESNNVLNNLCWGTWEEQAKDRKRHGTDGAGERHGMAKLRNADIPLIVAACRDGEPQRSVAIRFGVSQAQIWKIVNGRSYRCVTEEL